MNASFDAQSSTEGTLTLHFDPEDYQSLWKKKMGAYKKNFQQRGFRKGHAPMTEVHKQYGKTLLHESVWELAHQSLFDYIEKYDIDTLGMPICLESDIDTLAPSNLSSCTFSFRIGLLPSFELPTMVNATTYRITTVDEGDLEEVIQKTRQEYATYNRETTVVADSFLVGDLEMDGKVLQAAYLIDLSKTMEPLLPFFLNKKQGDAISLSSDNLQALYSLNPFDKNVEKALLKASDATYTYRLHTIHVQQLPELNQDFYTKVFGKKIESEEAFREKVIEAIIERDQERANALLYQSLKEAFIKATSLPLPDDIIKKWLQRKSKNPVDPANIEQAYPFYARSLRWHLILEKLTETHDLSPSNEEIEQRLVEHFKAEAQRQEEAPATAEQLKTRAQKERQNEKSDLVKRLVDQMQEANALDIIKGMATLEETTLSSREFYDKIAPFRS
ncbi:MAG: trigger factor [Bacteroidota bacterium]